ncbi:hypothetical protein ACLKA6_017020 [Drosophila palustris]
MSIMREQMAAGIVCQDTITLDDTRSRRRSSSGRRALTNGRSQVKPPVAGPLFWPCALANKMHSARMQNKNDQKAVTIENASKQPQRHPRLPLRPSIVYAIGQKRDSSRRHARNVVATCHTQKEGARSGMNWLVELAGWRVAKTVDSAAILLPTVWVGMPPTPSYSTIPPFLHTLFSILGKNSTRQPMRLESDACAQLNFFILAPNII